MKGSPHLGPATAPPPVASHASPIQRAATNRQQAGRSSSLSMVPPLRTADTVVQSGHDSIFPHAPPFPPHPPQASSPSASRPPSFATHGELSSSTSNFPPQQMHQHQRPGVGPQRSSFTQHSAIPGSTPGQLTTPPGPVHGKPSTTAAPHVRLAIGLHLPPPPHKKTIVLCIPGSFPSFRPAVGDYCSS
jgi:hypothetical protein